MGKRGRFEKKRSRNKKRTGRVLLVFISILLVAAAIVSVLDRYAAYLSKSSLPENLQSSNTLETTAFVLPDVSEETIQPDVTETTQAYTEEMTEPPEDILNFLVIGQAAREGDEYHTADTMILVTVNTFNRTLTLTSFLRDAYLQLPDFRDLSGRWSATGMQRLGTCYHTGYTIGGPEVAMKMLNQCLYDNFGVEVDFTVEVDFEGVEQIVNYLGGIELYLTQEETDYLNGDDRFVCYDVQPGPTLLDGLAAISYVRMLHLEGENGGDVMRTYRQRVVLERLVDKIRYVDTAGLQRLIEDFLPYVTTDLTNDDITRCVTGIFPVLPELRIETMTCPLPSTYREESVLIGGYPSAVLVFDETENRNRITALTEGLQITQ